MPARQKKFSTKRAKYENELRLLARTNPGHYVMILSGIAPNKFRGNPLYAEDEENIFKDFKRCLIPKEAAKCWDRIGDELDMVGDFSVNNECRILEGHHSIVMFALLLKHLEVAERQLKLNRVRESLRYTFGLTMATIAETFWWHDSQVSTKDINTFLARLSKVWTSLFLRSDASLGLGKQTRVNIVAKLHQMRDFWEWATKPDDATDDTPYINFPFPRDETDHTSEQSERAKKRRRTGNSTLSDEGSAEEDVTRFQVVDPPVGTKRLQKWCDMFMPKAVQRGAWQLRCELVPRELHKVNEASGKFEFQNMTTSDLRKNCEKASEGRSTPIRVVEKRIVIVSGSYTMFALNKAIAQAFGWGVAVFEHHVNKGRCPSDSRFVLNRSFEISTGKVEACSNVVVSSRKNSGFDGKSYSFVNDRKVKVCHIFRRRGDGCSYLCEGNHVVITCDGCLSDKSRFRNRQPLPRCAGYNDPTHMDEASLLNDQYCGERAGVVVMMSELSEEKLIEVTRDGMKKPLFDNTGSLLKDQAESADMSTSELWSAVLGDFQPRDS